MKAFLNKFIVLVVATICLSTLIFAVSCGKEGDKNPQTGNVFISQNIKSDILVSDKECKQIKRAADDLQTDILSVSGVTVAVKTTKIKADTAIIVGQLGSGGFVDEIVNSGKFDEAKGIENKWECFAIKIIDSPIDGIKKALVIAGSDMRGTVYGIYEISQKIGVSPWHYFADVSIERRDKIIFDFSTIVSKEPSVKYRGIFINDEFNFSTWAKSYQTTGGAPNYEVYSRVFELLLRLKANTLWPGMHGVSTAFYAYKDGDGVSLNAKYADAYGVVIGTSHCEQCLRNNVGEWGEWVRANSGKYGLGNTAHLSEYSQTAPYYDYSLYPEAVAQYWRERIEETKDFESLITIGMRGVHDEGFSYAGLKDKSFENRVALLQSVIDKQLEIIKDVYGENYEEKVQLVYIPYKEASDYYYGVENGKVYNTKITLPEHVMLMWAEDNYGYLRQTPSQNDVITTNGYGNMGIYYHISYVGVPCVYIWTDLTSYGTVYEEMKRAYDTGANGYWIVNVGDIKPGEYGMEYFLRLAYDIDKYDDSAYTQYMYDVAKRDFTDDDRLAQRIAALSVNFKKVAETYKSDFAGKENMPALSSISAGDEAMRLVNTLEEFYNEGGEIYKALDEDKKDAFFETVYYAIRGEYFAVKRVVYAWRTQLYYKQGRYLAVQKYAEQALLAQDMLEADVEYFNNGLHGGKWCGMMNEHIGAAYYGIVTREELQEMIISAVPSFGVNGIGAVAEGQSVYEEGGKLSFTSLGREERFIDVYNMGAGTQNYYLEKPDYIKVDYSGKVSIEERLKLTVDWSKVNESKQSNIVITDDFGNRYVFGIDVIINDVSPEDDSYYILNGVASIEAEKYTQTLKGEDGTYWDIAEGLGRSGSSIRIYPDTATSGSNDYSVTAKVVYRVYSPTTARYNCVFYRIPTLNENGSCNFAVGVGSTIPQTIEGTYRTGQSGWGAMVMPRIEKLSTTLLLKQGYNDICIYRVDPYIAIDKIVMCEQGISDDTYYGLTETFNTFGYTPCKVADLPSLGQTVDVNKYERPSDNFNFGLADSLNSHYVNMDTINGIYSAEKGFGFGTKEQADAVESVYRKTALGSDRNKTFVHSTTDSKFYIDIPSGKYAVALAIGDMLESGMAFNMSAYVNGLIVFENKYIPAGGTKEYCVAVVVNDGRLEVEFKGDWCINAIEVYKYNEYKKGGSGKFVVDENGGYIEAESALENSEYASARVGINNGREWTLTAGVSEYALMAGPDSGKTNTNTSPLTGASLHYSVYFKTGGTYYVWALVKMTSADDDSFHIAWDDKYAISYNPSKRKNGFVWVYTRYTVNVNANSTHKFSVWQREDGMIIDKFYFSPYNSWNSGGWSESDKLPFDDGAEVRQN